MVDYMQPGELTNEFLRVVMDIHFSIVEFVDERMLLYQNCFSFLHMSNNTQDMLM